MHELQCPACGEPLDTAGRTDRCKNCDGAWIGEDALVGMLQERTSTLVFLPWQPREQDNERSCAACGKPMQWVNLGTVKLDRCPAHGVWFDADELAALLAQAKEFKADPKHPDPAHSGLLHQLAKLFGG